MKWDTTRTLYLLSFISITSLILFSYLPGILFLKNSKSSVMSNRLSDVRKCRFRCRLFVCVSFFLFGSRLNQYCMKQMIYGRFVSPARRNFLAYKNCLLMFDERVGGVLHKKTVSLDLFIFSTNLNISLLIFSTKLEVKLSWTLIFKFLYFFFPFFKTTY